MVTNYTQQRRIVYTADDERSGMYIGPELTRWTIRDFSGQVLREFQALNRTSDPHPNDDTVWTWREDYVHANGTAVVAVRESIYGGKLHLHRDHLGSVRMITTTSGRKISLHDYYPFGSEQTSVVQEYVEASLLRSSEPMKFAGHERDYHGGDNLDQKDHDYVDYMHARFYSPHWGRFLSVDPAADSVSLGAPQTWNRYTYAVNNPANVTDPTGAVPCDANVIAALPAGTICEQAEAVDPLTEARDEFGRQMDSWLLAGMMSLSNFSAGFGDSLTFGATSAVRDLTGANEVVDKCSDAFAAGEYTELALEIAATGGSTGLRIERPKSHARLSELLLAARRGRWRANPNRRFITLTPSLEIRAGRRHCFRPAACQRLYTVVRGICKRSVRPSTLLRTAT